MEQRECKTCGNEYPLTKDFFYQQKLGYFYYDCKECFRNREKQRYINGEVKPKRDDIHQIWILISADLEKEICLKTGCKISESINLAMHKFLDTDTFNSIDFQRSEKNRRAKLTLNKDSFENFKIQITSKLGRKSNEYIVNYLINWFVSV